MSSWPATLRVAWLIRKNLTPPPPWQFRSFGRSSVVVPPVRVTEPGCIDIGADVVIHEDAWLSVVRAHDHITPRLVLGDRVRLGRGIHIACIGEVVLEDDVASSDDVFVADCYHDYSDPETPVLDQPMSLPRPVRICAGAYLGAESVVLQGVTVGERAYVGEGAVVTKDVPPGSVVYGNPATVVKWPDPR